MAQAITDVKTFLEDARQAVVELAEFEKQEETLAQEEKKRLRVLETERKAVADAVNSTVKRRRDEIEKSYDDELGKLQDKLKRTRTRREKAKNQGIKERIKEETQELHAHNRELSVRMRTLFQSDRVPFVCKSPLYYALYFPRGFKEFLTVLITFAICFLLIPCGIYKLLPEQKTLYLAMIYGVDVVVFGQGWRYSVDGGPTKMYPDWKLDEGSPSGGAAGRTFDPQSDRGEQPQDRGDHLLDPPGSQ